MHGRGACKLAGLAGADEGGAARRWKEAAAAGSAQARVGDKGEGEEEGGGFVCGACSQVVGGVAVEGVCGATLVVCPAAILQQWEDEIARHTKPGAVRVLVYEGVAHHQPPVASAARQLDAAPRSSPRAAEPTPLTAEINCPPTNRVALNRWRNGGGAVVGAHELAAADIVLTTYDALRADVNHDTCEATQQRSLRFEKRCGHVTRHTPTDPPPPHPPFLPPYSLKRQTKTNR
eukprot:jgi/Mesen1/881/ME000115S00006